MRVIKDTSEQDMVAVFLKAEINSSRWGPSITKLLEKHEINRKVIDIPNLDSKEENAQRGVILGEFRGYGKNDLLFKGFPKKVDWKRVELDKQDLSKVRYINYDYWVKLSNGSRLVQDAIINIKKGVEIFGESNNQFWKLSEFIKTGGKFPEVILISNKLGQLTLLEGHVRLTSYLLAGDNPQPLEVIIGYPVN